MPDCDGGPLRPTVSGMTTKPTGTLVPLGFFHGAPGTNNPSRAKGGFKGDLATDVSQGAPLSCPP